MLDHPLRPVVSKWREAIRLASDHKWKRFGEDAAECLSFYNGPHDFLYEQKYGRVSKGFVIGATEEMPPPAMGMTVNKAAELVQIFGPVLYHKNPIRKVNPRKAPMLSPEVFGDPNDPMVQQMFLQQQMLVKNFRAVDGARSGLLEFYLNYTPTALDLKTHMRAGIDEALIKGMGVLWTETYRPKGMGITLVGSFYDSVDNLIIDGDAESIEEAQWIARRCIHPVWMVERDYGLPRGTLKGNMESLWRQAEAVNDEDLDYNRRRGLSNDLIVYWKVWSKMGIGGRLAGAPPAMRDALEQFGDYCYLVICEECPYPLNLPPNLTENTDNQELWLRAVQWPTPFWADDSWPFTEIMFHPVPRQTWPMSHLKPAMGELKFLDWAYSFVASKIRITCRDFVAIKKSASEELKNIILTGHDLTLLEIEQHHGTISDIVQFLQHPQFNGDIWHVIQAVEHNFEKRTGLTELMYGSSAKQLRSASEAEIKEQSIKVRPDDMATRVEDAASNMARKEALAARWHLTGKDVQPILGPLGGQWWQQFLELSDPSEVLHSLEYRIEAGSAKKPNKQRDADNMGLAVQTILPILVQYAQASGDVGPVNALMADWAKANDIEAEKYLLKPPPPPPPPMPGPQGPPPAGPPK